MKQIVLENDAFVRMTVVEYETFMVQAGHVFYGVVTTNPQGVTYLYTDDGYTLRLDPELHFELEHMETHR